jgi:DnaK suppressor protein
MAAKKTLKKTVGGKAAKKVVVTKSKSVVAKKVVKKAVVKKATAKKVVVKKAPVKKTVVKKAPVKKVAVKKAPVKKVLAKKAPVKKAVVKKVVEKKVVEQKVPVKEVVEKKVVKEIKAKVEVKVVGPKKNALGGNVPVPAVKKAKFVPPPVQVMPKVSSHGGGSHSAAFIDKQRQRLLELRDTLVDSMSGMTRDTIRNAPEGSEASGSGQHQGDAGSDAYDRDFALSVLAKEQDALYEIEQALRRIKNGTYGVCEISEVKIPVARLEAIPFARLTVECQAQWEKEYGNRRFRPSDEVGFSGGVQEEDEDSVTVSLDGDDE